MAFETLSESEICKALTPLTDSSVKPSFDAFTMTYFPSLLIVSILSWATSTKVMLAPDLESKSPKNPKPILPAPITTAFI